MQNWKKSKVKLDTPLIQVLRAINDANMQMAFVVDDENHLLGIITDGDARRAILRGATNFDRAETIMNPNPIVFYKEQKKAFVINKMQEYLIRHAPVVSADGILIDFYELQSLLAKKTRSNPVVIMAGGLGVRLRPLTNDCPKPLLKVGNKPILLTVLESFIEYGFKKFYFSVNYRSEMIEQYFGDGKRYGVEISYIHESERMGTAGSLYYLSDKIKEPAFVMNGDILTKLDFGDVVDFHIKQQADATMLVKEMSYKIPYGVVQCSRESIERIEEKPTQTYYINAGMYVLSPDVISFVTKKTFLDMPDLFMRLIDNKLNVKAFQVYDYWLDIGKLDDFHKAQIDYTEVFGD